MNEQDEGTKKKGGLSMTSKKTCKIYCRRKAGNSNLCGGLREGKGKKKKGPLRIFPNTWLD